LLFLLASPLQSDMKSHEIACLIAFLCGTCLLCGPLLYFFLPLATQICPRQTDRTLPGNYLASSVALHRDYIYTRHFDREIQEEREGTAVHTIADPASKKKNTRRPRPHPRF
jgi:hypothetical protein